MLKLNWRLGKLTSPRPLEPYIWLIRLFPGTRTPYYVASVLFRAMYKRATIVIETSVAALSIFATAWALLTAGQNSQMPASIGISALVATALAVFVIWLVVTGIVALRTLSPEEWAEAHLVGRPLEHVLAVMADSSEAILLEFLNATENDRPVLRAFGGTLGHSLEDIDDSLVNPTKSLWTDNRPNVQAVAKCVEEQRQHLRRLEACKVVAARDFGMPFRRLCDHVLRFSPSIYKELAQKYADNWLECNDSAGELSAGDVRRFRALIAQNVDLRNNINFRLDLQRQQRRFAFLAPLIVRLGAERSTSSAVMSYAKALYKVAHWDDGQTKNFPVVEALKFFVSRRGAHAGVDVHDLLTTLCRLELKALEGTPPGHSARRHGAVPPLKRIIALLDRLKTGDVSPTEDLPTEDLRMLHIYVARHLDYARQNISQQFFRFLETWSETFSGRIYFATYGFSRLVRDLLTAPQTLEFLSANSGRRGDVFLMSGSQQRALDTRLMQYELKEQRRIRKSTGDTLMFENVIAVADPDFIFKALEPGDGILFIMGAEAWTSGPRALHPRGLGAMENVIYNNKHNKKPELPFCQVMFVAERYKRVDRLSSSAEVYADSEVRMDLQGSKLIDHLLSEDGLYPKGSTAAVPAHLHNGSTPANPVISAPSMHPESS